MKFILFAIVALFVALSLADTDEEKFQSFIQKYGKSYGQAEYSTRFTIFKQNLRRSEELTAKDKHATFGVTKFSDLTQDEFRETYLISNLTENSRELLSKATKWVAPRMDKFSGKPLAYPASFDWNSEGVVTPVYNQGQCGSCWAFSTAENIESMWALSGQTLTKLSMQQIVDCDTNDGGCNGGNPPYAYQYVMNAGGLEYYADYPYVGVQTRCNFNGADIAVSISDWNWITQDDNEGNMQSFVYSTGPPSICVDATIWQTYTSGVITSGSGCGTRLDHCVQLTGWQQMDGMSVWNVRNSWGADWADNGGYIYLQMGYDVCGIGQEVTSSII
jgi:C1A family cysteine protease